jgi:hypothetical protein
VFRTGMALTALIIVYFCLGLLAIWSVFRDWLAACERRTEVLVDGRRSVSLRFSWVRRRSSLRHVTTLVADHEPGSDPREMRTCR